MTLLYYFSMLNNYTLPNLQDFLCQSSKTDFKLVVLMQIKEQKQSLINILKQAQADIDLNNISFIAPEINDAFAPKNTCDLLSQASGILVLGGNTHFYQKIYANEEISQIILDKYQTGIPYAGISAGAILSLRYNLLNDLVLKPHFSEKRRFDELIKKMKKNKVNYGFGLDDNMSLKITNKKDIECLGKDSFYLFTKVGDYDFNFRIFKNLDKIGLV